MGSKMSADKIQAGNITADILIEELVQRVPESVTYLMEQGIRCLRCGEPLWGSLASAALDKGFTKADIDRFVAEINKMDRSNA